VLEFGAEGPYDGYTGVFEHRDVSMQPLSDAQQAEREARLTGDAPQNFYRYFVHQVGGYPVIYNPCKAFCPKCSKERPVVAAICDGATGNDDFRDDPSETFTGNSGVQMVFQLCRDCSVLTAYHSCD